MNRGLITLVIATILAAPSFGKNRTRQETTSIPSGQEVHRVGGRYRDLTPRQKFIAVGLYAYFRSNGWLD